MCELFGISGSNKIRVNEYLREFFSHSTEHPDGWGYVTFESNFDEKSEKESKHNSYSLIKEALPAYKSKIVEKMLEEEITEANMFAHIRQATRGDLVYDNCHPFVGQDNSGRTWIVSHNGTIFDYPQMDKYKEVQKGATDSERILFYILDIINKKQLAPDAEETGEIIPLTDSERFAAMDEILCNITKNNNKVNLMVWDGEYIYIHTNLKNTLYMKEDNGCRVFSTQPLDNSPWENVPFTQLLVYKNGRLVFTGTNHGNEYFEQ